MGAKTRLVPCCLLAAIVLWRSDRLHAGEHYDEQGASIQYKLGCEFPIPVDGMDLDHPVKGVYWTPYPYWDWVAFHRVDSSEIVIYGVKDQTTQDLILKRISELKDQRRILVTFYDDSKFKVRYNARGHGSSRLPSQLLRQELLK